MHKQLKPYLEKYFAEFLASSEPAKMLFLSPNNVIKSFREMTNLILLDDDVSYIENATVRFKANYHKYRALGNVTDIAEIQKRMRHFARMEDRTIESQIDYAYHTVFGDLSEYTEVEEGIENKSEVLSAIAKIQKIEDQLKNIAELTEKVIKIEEITRDGKLDLAEAWDLVKDKIGEDYKPLFEAIQKTRKEVEEKLFKKSAIYLSNLITKKIGAPLEQFARGRRAIEAAQLMGFLDEVYNTDSTFKNYRAFMLTMLDIFPYEGESANSSEQHNKLAELFLKKDIAAFEHGFIEKVFNHLQGAIQNRLDNIVKKELGLKLTHKSDNQITPLHIEYSHVKESINQLLHANYFVSTNLTNVNSRVIARHLAPLFEASGSPEQNHSVLLMAFNDYKHVPGVSLLSICNEVKDILENEYSQKFINWDSGNGKKELDLSYLSNIRPTGSLENFAYASPDTNTPTIRAINNVNAVSNAIEILSKTMMKFDDSIIGKLDKAEHFIDVFQVFYENWKENDVKLEDVIKSIGPMQSNIHRKMHSLMKNGFYANERSEFLTKTLADLTNKGLFNQLPLDRSSSLKLLALMRAAYKYDVLDADITTIDLAIKNINLNKDISSEQISTYFTSILTNTVKDQLTKYAAMSNLPDQEKLKIIKTTPSLTGVKEKVISIDDAGQNSESPQVISLEENDNIKVEESLPISLKM
jgi:hypothetical protein